MQVTASQTKLLFQCTRPFAEDTYCERQTPTSAMQYGSALHAILESKHKKNVIDADDFNAKYSLSFDDVERHASEVWATLQAWLAGNNPWSEKFRIVCSEKPLATKIRYRKMAIEVTSRDVAFDPAEHHYDMAPGEIAGTSDLLVASEKRRVVIDYKSGWFGEFTKPAEIPQMLTLALQTDADGVAIIHAPQGAPVAIYADDVSADTLQAHARLIKKRLRLIGDGTLRPGPECGHCPAAEGCPAKDGELLKRSAALVKSVIESGHLSNERVGKGAMHLFLSQFAALERRARESIKNSVLAGAVIERPDGKTLQIITKEYETFVSKRTILEELGHTKGEALLDKLRKMGVLRMTEREELHAK